MGLFGGGGRGGGNDRDRDDLGPPPDPFWLPEREDSSQSGRRGLRTQRYSAKPDY